jgi:hypothetical protein
MEVELRGGHHRQLLQGNKAHFEKVVASVIQDLMGPAFDVYRLSLAELFFAFFMTKAATLGPTWKFNWACQQVRLSNSQEVRCGTSNDATYDLRTAKLKVLDKGFTFTPFKIRLDPVEGADPSIAPGSLSDATLRVLNIAEEFDIIDGFLGEGESRERLLAEKSYDIYSRRVAAAMVIDHPWWSQATASQKEALLDLNPMTLKASLLKQMNVIDGVGFPLQTHGKCSGCNSEVALHLPFLAGLVVRS